MGGVDGVGASSSNDELRRLEHENELARAADAKVGKTSAEMPWVQGYAAILSSPTGPIHLTPVSAAPAMGLQGPVDPAMQAKSDAIVHPERTFTDPRSLAKEIYRLRDESAKKPGTAIASALKMRTIALQAQWVDLATKAGIPKPTARLDPITATPREVANAFAWHDLGGVTPTSELQADGGQAFDASVKDAATLQTQGFDAMIKRHSASPDEQKALLRRELTRLGDTTTPSASDSTFSLTQRRYEVLAKLRGEQLAKDFAPAVDPTQLYMGLDGQVGTLEDLVRYERTEAVNAAVSDSTAGSILATTFGGGDIEKMRALGALGSAAEGVAGGAAVVIENNRREAVEPKDHKAVAEEGRPRTVKEAPTGPNALVINEPARPAAPRTESTGPTTRASANPVVVARPSAAPVDTGQSAAVTRVEPFSSDKGTFRTTNMQARYVGEDQAGPAGSKAPVLYCRTNADRAKFKLEVKLVEIDGKMEARIFDAQGNLFDTSKAQTWKGQTKAIFVMNADGEVFASPYQEVGVFHHSSLAGGQAIAAAGELSVIDGKLVAVTNQSGHYMPSADFTNQFLASMQNKGLRLRGVKVVDIRTSGERVMP